MEFQMKLEKKEKLIWKNKEINVGLHALWRLREKIGTQENRIQLKKRVKGYEIKRKKNYKNSPHKTPFDNFQGLEEFNLEDLRKD